MTTLERPIVRDDTTGDLVVGFRATPLRMLRHLLSIGLAAGLLVAAVPLLTGAPWAQVVTLVQQVSWTDLLVLTGVWAGGLTLYAFVLTAALPGLTHRRALTLSLTGSAVANMLPLGGAAGIALNHRMTRTWGFGHRAFGVYTIVTNLWDVLAKLCLPLAATAWLLATGYAVVGAMMAATVGASVVLALVSLVVTILLASERATRLVAGWVESSITRLLRAARVERRVSICDPMVHLRAETAALVARGWFRLTAGTLTYNVTLVLLLWGCLHVTGVTLAPAAVFAGFALERVLTLVGLTPGGAGVVEVGLSGLLILLGADPAASVTGVLLYRAFTFWLEIPVGGLGLAAWLWTHRLRRPPRPTEAVT